VKELLESLPPEEKGLLRESDLPRKPTPMLAVLSDKVFSDPGWVFERKLDGERVMAVASEGRVGLRSRNGKDVSTSYPEVVEALRGAVEAGAEVVLDGEIVAFSGSITSFARLQRRMRVRNLEEARESDVAVYYYLFDLLHLGGFDLSDLPLRARKSLLKEAVTFADPLRFTPHRNEEGEAMHREACRKGWEGVMAKEADSPYRRTRSRSWLKLKCVNRQELVIGGFTEPGGRRTGFGALLVGYYEDGGKTLRYAGKVGTGVDEETLQRVSRLLRARERRTPPFSKADVPDLPREEVHWVTPNLVGQFGFTEWTEAGKLRHPRFLGLRRDKDPEDVEREEPRSGAAGREPA